jgi:hypothetical protein
LEPDLAVLIKPLGAPVAFKEDHNDFTITLAPQANKVDGATGLARHLGGDDEESHDVSIIAGDNLVSSTQDGFTEFNKSVIISG